MAVPNDDDGEGGVEGDVVQLIFPTDDDLLNTDAPLTFDNILSTWCMEPRPHPQLGRRYCFNKLINTTA